MGTLEASTHISIRPYVSADADTTLTVFQDAITVTAAADYSPEQIAAWARLGSRDVSAWDRSMRGRDSYVAIVDGRLAGFADIGGDGYIDKMFVSPDFARRGVARALMAFLENQARHHRLERLSADVSITARPFFEESGFRVDAEQHPMINGVPMTNFRMTKVLEPLR